MPDNQPTDPPPADTPAQPVPTPQLAAQPDVDPGYNDRGVPTFESVREKIESRYETSVGAAELDAESTEGRSVEEQYEAREKAAAERLAEIRESMRADHPDDA
jgi:phage shock protein A